MNEGRRFLDASIARAWCFPYEATAFADRVLVAFEGVPMFANAITVGERKKRAVNLITPSDARPLLLW